MKFTPLGYAIEEGKIEVIVTLLKNRVNVEKKFVSLPKKCAIHDFLLFFFLKKGGKLKFDLF